MTIHIAKTDEEILECFDILTELRPHLKKEKFLEQIRRQQEQNFFLVFIKDNGEVVSVAGFHITENLANGKFVYVDDLITGKRFRSKKYGETFLDWIIKFAQDRNCKSVELDSGVQRFDAHRFYLRSKMKISCHHFTLDLKN